MEKYKVTEEKVFSFIKKHNIFEPDDIVVAGVSGGADSVCLLFMLLELRKRLQISFEVVHVNHGIRRDAAQDAAYVERLCRENDIPFCQVERDVRKLAQEQHCSEEEMGRLVRYEAFRQAAKECGAGKIAVAHNLNDKSETMLFNLFRGSGIKGLGSIRAVNGDIVRPLLCLERSEIEEYLRERNISYCMDATNCEDDYTRNRIRHHILPYAEEQIVQGSTRHTAAAAQELGEIDEYLEQQTDKLIAAKACVEKTDFGYIINAEELSNEHTVIVKRLIYRILYELSPHAKDITARHVEAVAELLTKKGNAVLDLPFGISVRLRYGKIYLSVGENGVSAGTDEEISSCVEAALTLDIIDCDGQLYKEVPQKKYTKWFDYDKIEQTPVLRYRQQGDYISVAGGNGEEIHKSLKKYFIDEKIPSEYRDRIKLLADGTHIIWVVGYRISEHYKVTENTRHILQVQLANGCTAEKTED
jgi:tRNA(Ile)-lysidine synthase